jgi:hypothetical protein
LGKGERLAAHRVTGQHRRKGGSLMEISRRSVLAGAAALAVAGPAVAKSAVKGRGGDWYGRAIVIDGLGGIGDPYTPDTQTRLSDRAWAEMKRTGVTAVNQTILPVGNQSDAWPEFLKNIDQFDNVLNANPDRLRLIRTAADLKAAKGAGQVGLIYGTQDTAMIGATLDRLAELNKRGIRVVRQNCVNCRLERFRICAVLEIDQCASDSAGHIAWSYCQRAIKGGCHFFIPA